MSKPITIDNLQDQMERDLLWRLKEISDLKSAIRSADGSSNSALLRAYVALLYAHWEGYVRHCTSKYFEHIAIRKMKYSQLESQFYKNSFHIRLDALFRSKESTRGKNLLLESILTSQNERFAKVDPKLVDTKGNLNSDVLGDLCQICGISFSGFEDYRIFIDKVILKRRNQVAHGEAVVIGIGELDDLGDKTIGIMRLFRNQLENKVYEKLYLAN